MRSQSAAGRKSEDGWNSWSFESSNRFVFKSAIKDEKFMKFNHFDLKNYGWVAKEINKGKRNNATKVIYRIPSGLHSHYGDAGGAEW